jgi:nucleotide-binding universal stress UspA family protein/GNAT superfamily N-acetyltransferase
MNLSGLENMQEFFPEFPTEGYYTYEARYYKNKRVFEKILFPTDFSEWAEETGKRLPEIPGLREVVMVHVLEPGEGGSTFLHPDEPSLSPKAYARARLAPLKELLQSSGFSVSLQVTEPQQNIADTILTIAADEKVSLIVMAARKKGILGNLFLGSVSAAVLLKSPVHVMITRFPEETEMLPPLTSRLLLPVDLSRPSQTTISMVNKMSGIQDAIVLHVFPEPERNDFEKVDGSLQQIVHSLQQSGMQARRIIRYGHPSEEICRVGEMEQVSLIVLSRFGQTDYIRNIQIGGTSAAVARCAHRPVLILHPYLNLHVETRELMPTEFGIAEEIWQYYHQLKADRKHDRIFCVFVEGIPVAVARGKRHSDGWEVDGVFSLDEFRNRGYARMVMSALVDALQNEVLYMHSTLEMVDFYRSFGFQPIAEKELPPSIRERFGFAEGNLQGVNVCPMKREQGNRE